MVERTDVESAQRMPLGDFKGLEAAHIISTHILMARIRSMAKLNCKGGWKMSFSYMPGRSESTFGKYLGSLYHPSQTLCSKKSIKNKHANANRIEKTLGFHDYSTASVKGNLLLKGIPTGLGVREKAEEWNWGSQRTYCICTELVI